MAGERAVPGCDINFYMEHPVPYFINDAQINILMCNYEFLSHAKTEIAKHFCDQLKQERGYKYITVYTRHTTQIEPIKPMPEDRMGWLHVGGTSPYKNTDIVIQAWQQHPEWPTLHVVCTGVCADNLNRYVSQWTRKNIIDLGPQKEIGRLQQKIQNHVCPSMVEGYGHYINEARARGRFIVTTDYPPMNELITADAGVLVPCSSIIPKRSSPGVYSCALTVESFSVHMQRALSVPQTDRTRMGKHARALFTRDTKFFERAMNQFVQKLQKLLK